MDVINDNIYIVKKGDSLYSIAQKYNTTAEELKRINNLDSNQLVIGQQLIIPTLEDIEENYYIVKAGDNLYSIANKYNISVEELKSINNLVTDNLYVGQKLLLVSNESKNDNVYVVKVGDTLYSIAKRYNIPVIDLINANNINDNIIVVGQELIIPNNISNNVIYIVEAGDTLYSIARKCNTTIKYIMDKNNLTSNILRTGQELKI
jgi:LysM repeat protein